MKKGGGGDGNGCKRIFLRNGVPIVKMYRYVKNIKWRGGNKLFEGYRYLVLWAEVV
jgi:hypothetical protein